MKSIEEIIDSEIINANDQLIKISDIYSRMDLRSIIFISLEETGIFFSDTDKESDQELYLKEYLFDSIQLIRFIVALEQNLAFELSDEIFLKDNIATIGTLEEALSNMYGKKLSQN